MPSSAWWACRRSSGFLKTFCFSKGFVFVFFVIFFLALCCQKVVKPKRLKRHVMNTIIEAGPRPAASSACLGGFLSLSKVAAHLVCKKSFDLLKQKRLWAIFRL